MFFSRRFEYVRRPEDVLALCHELPQFPDAFAEASNKLNLVYGSVNRVVLLSSSLTAVLAVHAARSGRRAWVTGCLVVTALLGATFLAIKGVEYHGDYAEKLVPVLAFEDAEWQNPAGVKLFLLHYYLMTGVHAIHLIVGIILMSVLAVLAWRDRFSEAHYTPVEVAGLYWHFVDVIWIFLLPMLYTVGVR